jgi:hypothetical protein
VKDPLDKQRWMLAALMSIIGFGVAWYASRHHLGWQAAAALSYGEALLVLVYVLWKKDRLIGSLLVFALVVGFGELPSDAYSVLVKKTLVYAPGEPMIWASPLYMPFTWVAVMVQMGFISWWLVNASGSDRLLALLHLDSPDAAIRRRRKVIVAMIILGLLGACYVPIYEHLAHGANFYYYQNCRMLKGITPYYIILAEGLLCAALPPLVGRIQERSWRGWIGLGIVESGIVLAASVLAFALVG